MTQDRISPETSGYIKTSVEGAAKGAATKWFQRRGSSWITSRLLGKTVGKLVSGPVGALIDISWPSNTIVSGAEERRMLREARSRTQSESQDIPISSIRYPDGTVQYPEENRWEFPPEIVRRSRPRYTEPDIEVGEVFDDGVIYWPESRHWDFSETPEIVTHLSSFSSGSSRGSLLRELSEQLQRSPESFVLPSSTEELLESMEGRLKTSRWLGDLAQEYGVNSNFSSLNLKPLKLPLPVSPINSSILSPGSSRGSPLRELSERLQRSPGSFVLPSSTEELLESMEGQLNTSRWLGDLAQEYGVNSNFSSNTISDHDHDGLSDFNPRLNVPLLSGSILSSHLITPLSSSGLSSSGSRLNTFSDYDHDGLPDFNTRLNVPGLSNSFGPYGGPNYGEPGGFYGGPNYGGPGGFYG